MLRGWLFEHADHPSSRALRRDLMDNFSEYALGGNPLDRADTGYTPKGEVVLEDA